MLGDRVASAGRRASNCRPSPAAARLLLPSQTVPLCSALSRREVVTFKVLQTADSNLSQLLYLNRRRSGLIVFFTSRCKCSRPI